MLTDEQRHWLRALIERGAFLCEARDHARLLLAIDDRRRAR